MTQSPFFQKILLCLGVIILGSVTYILHSNPPAKISVNKLSQPMYPTSKPMIRVHIAGAVHHPGVYNIEVGTRTLEALSIAGGATTDAHLDKLNLAKIVKDGMRLFVPYLKTKPSSSKKPVPLSDTTLILLNPNTATLSQLITIPGVGPKMADAIIKYRQEHGPFQSITDLEAVKFIGPTRLKKLKRYFKTDSLR